MTSVLCYTMQTVQMNLTEAYIYHSDHLCHTIQNCLVAIFFTNHYKHSANSIEMHFSPKIKLKRRIIKIV